MNQLFYRLWKVEDASRGTRFSYGVAIGPHRSLGPVSHGTSHCIFPKVTADCCNLKNNQIPSTVIP